MLTENVLYEGIIHGLTEYQYRKLIGHLRNAFEKVDYKYHGDSGSLLVRGASAMFAEDPENLTATLDLLTNELADGAKGVILQKQWTLDGTVTLSAYIIKGKSWQSGSVDFDE